MVYANFWLNQIQNCSIQIKNMKDEIFRVQLKKYLCWKSADYVRHENEPSPVYPTRILKSCYKSYVINSQKNRSDLYQMR